MRWFDHIDDITKLGLASTLRNNVVYFAVSALSICWSLLPIYTQAEESLARGSGESSMEQVVVTGTRTERLLSDSPIPIDVINAVEIGRISQGTLEPVLELLSGVDITRNDKDGFNVQIQGYSGTNVLVLVDGLRVISPTGDGADFGQIAALNVCLLYTSPSPRDKRQSRMPSSA